MSIDLWIQRTSVWKCVKLSFTWTKNKESVRKAKKKVIICSNAFCACYSYLNSSNIRSISSSSSNNTQNRINTHESSDSYSCTWKKKGETNWISIWYALRILCGFLYVREQKVSQRMKLWSNRRGVRTEERRGDSKFKVSNFVNIAEYRRQKQQHIPTSIHTHVYIYRFFKTPFVFRVFFLLLFLVENHSPFLSSFLSVKKIHICILLYGVCVWLYIHSKRNKRISLCRDISSIFACYFYDLA